MADKHHIILTKATDFETAKNHVLDFFEKTILLHYDHMEVITKKSYRGSDSPFWPAVENGIDENRLILRGLVQELQGAGCQKAFDLNTVQQGYQSKTLHIIAHFLDGFVGIDSALYNLLEDSHWLSPSLQKGIKQEPQNYWLIYLEVSFSSTSSASLIHSTQQVIV